MFGAIFGDIIGSYYETHCTKDYNFEFHRESTFTDDSILTAATCRAILFNPQLISIFDIKKRALEYAVQYKQYYSYFPYAGFGVMFSKWAKDKECMTRQHSYGNGGAMRVVPIGYAYPSLKQTCILAKASCLYTHHIRSAIRGAQAVASAVWLANHQSSKQQIKNYIEKNFHY